MRSAVILEPLEARALLSGGALGIAQTMKGGIPTLLVGGGGGNDRISITQSAGLLTISSGKRWSTWLPDTFRQIVIHGKGGNDRIVVNTSVTIDCAIYGDDGNDKLHGGSGNDRLYGGSGRDAINGGAGDDVLVDLDANTRDKFAGGPGLDSFWLAAAGGDYITDLTPFESAAGARHSVAGFYNQARPSRSRAARANSLPGQKLNEPACADESLAYRNFSSHPLFSPAGPSADDVVQGAVGDCYMLGALAAVARSRPQIVRQLVADLGDGTYAVQFYSKNRRYFVRVDGDLPVTPRGALAYADFGRGGSLWVAIYEKAYAVFRNNANSYDALDGGWLDEANAALGALSHDRGDFTNPADLVNWARAQLDAGNPLTLGTYEPPGAPVLDHHAYSVDSVLTDATGAITGVTLRNPWGVDGVVNPSPDDGYVTLTPQQLFDSYWMIVSAQF